jgi:GNAT superfamily N-acetyltransferase
MKIQLWNKKDAIFEGVLDPVYLSLDHCEVYFIENKGFVVLNHDPKYLPYKKLNIPEIQDLYIMPDHRRQGWATQLINFCETQAGTYMIGISVPLSAEYGGAQRLYSQLGYFPDGNGVTYDRERVIHNAHVRVDDDLCLMMVKDLK